MESFDFFADVARPFRWRVKAGESSPWEPITCDASGQVLRAVVFLYHYHDYQDRPLFSSQPHRNYA